MSESKLADSFRTMMTKEGRAEYFGLLRMRNKEPFAFSDFYRRSCYDPVVDGKLAEAADREAMSALEYMYCLIAGKFVDVSYEKGAEAVNESLNMEAELDGFVRSFGHFDVTMPDDDGNPVVIQVPFVAGVFVYVNKALRSLGIDGMHVDLGEVMPENVPYENRKAIIKRLNGIPGAKYEIEFLRPRYEEKFDDVFPVGAEKPTFDKGTDWHRYAR